LLYLFLYWFLTFSFIIMNFWNLLVSRFRFSVSLHSSKLPSLESTSLAFVLRARLLVFPSTISISFSLVISNSCSLSLPKSVAVVSVVKSLVSNIIVTLGCQLLLRHFKILMFSSSLSNYLPSPIKWLTMRVNLFCTSSMVSPCCILNNSSSWINACFLALFTSMVPSCVTSSMSHISLAKLHCEKLINGSKQRLLYFSQHSHIALSYFQHQSTHHKISQHAHHSQQS